MASTVHSLPHCVATLAFSWQNKPGQSWDTMVLHFPNAWLLCQVQGDSLLNLQHVSPEKTSWFLFYELEVDKIFLARISSLQPFFPYVFICLLVCLFFKSALYHSSANTTRTYTSHSSSCIRQIWNTASTQDKSFLKLIRASSDVVNERTLACV